MLTDALKRQFNCAFDILAAAVGSFTPQQWRSGPPPYDGPARAAAHALQAAEFYTCEDRTVFTKLGKKVSEMADDELPSQERMGEYLLEVRQETLLWIDSLRDDGLAAPYPTDEAIIGMDRVVYALRHLQHHTGEVCAYQKGCGLTPAPWR